eukprot:TRINITY_DN3616_c0_g1_i1.p1 TRINITY_DN3616_c0_g1~~TRINITY_DN3616_c0_g1_i1.p1  ORF type:complete len:373 (+),score=35.48 TRINITY_DN3616_c0_g1_i1:58-1119(+)
MKYFVVISVCFLVNFCALSLYHSLLAQETSLSKKSFSFHPSVSFHTNATTTLSDYWLTIIITTNPSSSFLSSITNQFLNSSNVQILLQKSNELDHLDFQEHKKQIRFIDQHKSVRGLLYPSTLSLLSLLKEVRSEFILLVGGSGESEFCNSIGPIIKYLLQKVLFKYLHFIFIFSDSIVMQVSFSDVFWRSLQISEKGKGVFIPRSQVRNLIEFLLEHIQRSPTSHLLTFWLCSASLTKSWLGLNLMCGDAKGQHDFVFRWNLVREERSCYSENVDYKCQVNDLCRWPDGSSTDWIEEWENVLSSGLSEESSFAYQLIVASTVLVKPNENRLARTLQRITIQTGDNSDLMKLD